jgi:hypothetical protein
VQERAGDVDPAELARRGLAGEDRSTGIAHSLNHHTGVGGDLISEWNRRVSVGPTVDLIELFDTDRNTAKGFAEICLHRGPFRLLTGCVTESVERARVNRVVRRLKFFTG